MIKGADISPCGKYRYSLNRVWDKSLKMITFVGLNPSTADAEKDDPTITRLINFTKRMGYGGFYIVNLFAFRATKPSDLKKELRPVGNMNDSFIWTRALNTENVVFCWGANGSHWGRDKVIAALFPEALCFGKTKDGHPKHPLYLKSDTELITFKN